MICNFEEEKFFKGNLMWIFQNMIFKVTVDRLCTAYIYSRAVVEVHHIRPSCFICYENKRPDKNTKYFLNVQTTTFKYK